MAQPNIYTTSNLLESVKLDAMTPANQQLFNNQRLTQVINKALHGSIQAQMMVTQADFFLTYEDIQTEQNVARYNLPKRAIGTKLKDVMWVINRNGSLGSESYIQIPQLDQATISSWNWQTASYAGFLIEGNQIVLYPPTPVAGAQTLRLYYYRRPNIVVEERQGAFVTFVDHATNTVTLSNLPRTSTGAQWIVGYKVDVVRPYPPFDSIIDSATITSINGYQFTLDTTEGIEIGDSIALENTAIVAQIPYDLYPLLSQAAAIQCFKDMSDKDGEALARKAYSEMATTLFAMIAPRVDNKPKRINGSGGIQLYTKSGYPWGNTF